MFVTTRDSCNNGAARGGGDMAERVVSIDNIGLHDPRIFLAFQGHLFILTVRTGFMITVIFKMMAAAVMPLLVMMGDADVDSHDPSLDGHDGHCQSHILHKLLDHQQHCRGPLASRPSSSPTQHYRTLLL